MSSVCPPEEIKEDHSSRFCLDSGGHGHCSSSVSLSTGGFDRCHCGLLRWRQGHVDLEWLSWAQVHCHVLLESSGAWKPHQCSALQCLLKGHSSTWETGAVGVWGRDLWPLKAPGDSHGQSHMSKMKTFGFCQWLRSSRLHQVWSLCEKWSWGRLGSDWALTLALCGH